MSANILQSISNHRSRNSQFLRNNETDRIKLFRKKSIVLKRTSSIARLSKDPIIKNQEKDSPQVFGRIYNDNLKKYSDVYKDVVTDLDYSHKITENGFILSRKKISTRDIVREKTQQQMNKNSEIQRERINYGKSYKTKFQNEIHEEDKSDVVVDGEVRNWKQYRSNRHSVETTTVTLSTIQKAQNIRPPKTTLLSILENKAKQFDARYSNVLDLPKQPIEEQQVFIERKKSHLTYVRHRQTKSSLNHHSNNNHQNNANIVSNAFIYHSNNTYKASNQLKMIERYTRQQVDFTRSMERQRQRRRERERERLKQQKQRQREREIEEFRDKVFISKTHLRQCTFPLEASRCHSLKKAMQNIQILQQL